MERPRAGQCNASARRHGEEGEVLATVTADDGPTSSHTQGRSKEHVAQEMTVVGEARKTIIHTVESSENSSAKIWPESSLNETFMEDKGVGFGCVWVCFLFCCFPKRLRRSYG